MTGTPAPGFASQWRKRRPGPDAVNDPRREPYTALVNFLRELRDGD